MNQTNVMNTYQCGSYSRLSQEDGDKKESDSISNQKTYIKSYAESHGLKLIKEYCDDGFSGVTFERPGFQEMLADIREGRINCVIVKDLSRFGRNYIEAGRYIEQIFPCMGIRFIAINDNYDSEHSRSGADYMMLPFKNLLNDAYSRDISVKTKTSLEVKRKKGEFVSNFAPYGYKKSSQNKNLLVIDEPAAEVVRYIYQLKISGKNNKAIANQLNLEGIPTPLAYKLSNGDRIPCAFQKNVEMKWCITTVARILKDETYYGNLLQGKSHRINYKVRKQITKPKEEWIRCENTHEPLVSTESLKLIQTLKQVNSRHAPGKDCLSLFSGLIVCGKCKKTLTRKTVGKYHYYGCYFSDRKIRCKGIAINENLLSEILLKIIQRQISIFTQMDELLQQVDSLRFKNTSVQKLTKQLLNQETELKKSENLIASMYSDLHNGVLEQDEYDSLLEIYRERITLTKERIAELEVQRQNMLEGNTTLFNWIASFKEYQNITSLDRVMLLALFKDIQLYPDKQLAISLYYEDELKELMDFTGLEEDIHDYIQSK